MNSGRCSTPVRWMAKTGSPWRAVYPQMRRWLDAGCFELLVGTCARFLREWADRMGQPTAVVSDTCLPWRSPRPTGDRAQVAELAEPGQQVTGSSVELAYGDQGYPGAATAEPAEEHGIRLAVVNHPAAKRGFVLLPRPWVVERSFAWAARLRRLARHYERLASTLAGLHLLALLMLRNLVKHPRW